MGKIDAEPHGAAEQLPNDSERLIPSMSTNGCDGKNGAKCY